MDPSSFVSMDVLKSFLGQVNAVMLMTLVAKTAYPAIPTYRLRLFCVLSGVLLNAALVWHEGQVLEQYVLSFVNGGYVAMAAMKQAEFVKGTAQ